MLVAVRRRLRGRNISRYGQTDSWVGNSHIYKIIYTVTTTCGQTAARCLKIQRARRNSNLRPQD